MLSVVLSTTDPGSSSELAVPAEILQKVRRASAFLESELARLSAKFDITMKWQFFHDSNGTIRAKLLFVVDSPYSAEVGPFTLPHDSPKDEVGMRDCLRPWVSKLIWKLSELNDERFDALAKRVRQDIEDFAVVSEE